MLGRTRGIAVMTLLGLALGGARASLAAEAARGRAATAPVPPLPFIEDDYARALELARRTGKPLFVDAWAPWCHTCVSMRSFVFSDPRMSRWAGRFVWLAIDTEKDGSAAFLAAHPIDTWPTLLVIDATGKRPARSWRGALMVDELGAWLEETLGAPDARDSGVKARATDARISELRRQKQNPLCVSEAKDALRLLPPGTARLDVTVEALTCAERLAPGAERQEALAFFTAKLLAIVGDDGFPVLADDRSSGFEALVDSAEAEHHPERARELAEHWAAFLEREAARAASPAARSVFDSHRLLAYMALGQPERAIPVLQASAAAFPRDYNPPARLARAYLAAGRIPEARAAITAALRLVYGPRRKRLVALEVEIEQAAAAPPAAARASQ